MKNRRLFSSVVPSNSFDIKENPWILNRRTGVWGKAVYDFSKEIVYGNAGIDESGEPKYWDVVEKDQRLYFAPAVQSDNVFIKIYDLNSNTEENIKIKNLPIRDIKNRDTLFSKILVAKNYVFFIGSAYPAIIRLDTSTREVEYIDGWTQFVDTSDKRTVMGFFSGNQFIVEEDNIYIPCSMNSGVLRVNIDTMKEEFIPIECGAQGLFSMIKYNQNHFLISCCGDGSNRLVLWNNNNHKVEKNIFLQGEESIYPVSYMLKGENDFIYIFPAGALNNGERTRMDIYCMSCIDFSLRNLSVLERIPMVFDEVIVGSIIMYAAWRDERTVIFVTGIDAEWYEYNIETENLVRIDIKMDQKDAEKTRVDFYRSYIDRGIPVDEEGLSLDEFLEIVS